jgi:hypothetical protein
VVRDSVTAKSPTDAKPDVKSGADTGKKDAGAGSDDSADGASSNAA